MTEHQLKTWQGLFDDVLYGRKTYELRKADRDFKVGDVLLLEEYIPDKDGFSGVYGTRKVSVVVTHILKGPFLGLKEGWVLMSTRLL